MELTRLCTLTLTRTMVNGFNGMIDEKSKGMKPGNEARTKGDLRN